MALKHFITHKNNFESNLANEKSGLSIKKFLRMISFTLTDLLITFPILLTEFSMELAYAQIKPYTSWDVVHADFKSVVEYPLYALSNLRGKRFLALSEVSSWALCICAFVFFGLFGVSVDAKASYVKVIRKLKTIIQSKAQEKLPFTCVFI